MARSLYINLDATNLRAASVRSATDFRSAIFTQLVAGDSIDLNLYAVNSSGLQNIQSYSSVRVAVGGSDARPNAGTYTIDTSNTLNYNHSASELEAIIDSAVADATVTELAPFVFKIQFAANGTQTIPTIDQRLLSPRSTVDVARMITGDSSTPETWLWRIYRNPLAFTSTFSNISGSGINGTLDLNTSGIYDLLATEQTATSFFEIELTSSSGNITTVLQAPVTILGEVIGQSFNGTVPTPPGMPPSASAFLEAFPDPTFSGEVSFDDQVEFGETATFGADAQFDGDAQFEGTTNLIGSTTIDGAEFTDNVTITSSYLEFDGGQLQFVDDDGNIVMSGGDITGANIASGGVLKASAHVEVGGSTGIVIDAAEIQYDGETAIDLDGRELRNNNGDGVVIFGSSDQVEFATNLKMVANSFVQFGAVTTTQRDALTAVNGMVIYNSTLNKFQGYENGAWVNLI